MTKLLMMASSTLFGSIGWYVAEPFGFFAAFVLSIVGTAVGVYAGRRLANHWGF